MAVATLSPQDCALDICRALTILLDRPMPLFEAADVVGAGGGDGRRRCGDREEPRPRRRPTRHRSGLFDEASLNCSAHKKVHFDECDVHDGINDRKTLRLTNFGENIIGFSQQRANPNPMFLVPSSPLYPPGRLGGDVVRPRRSVLPDGVGHREEPVRTINRGRASWFCPLWRTSRGTR